MSKSNKPVPAKDANESQKAYRERIRQEEELKRRRADFNRFVAEKKEDFTLTVLGSILQHTKTDKTKIAENVGIAVAYADELLTRLYNISKAPDKPVEEVLKPQEPAEPEGNTEGKQEEAVPEGTV